MGKKKLTKKNVGRVMAHLCTLVEKDAHLRWRLNEWLDEQAENDAFGTEAQSDPRGDQRD